MLDDDDADGQFAEDNVLELDDEALDELPDDDGDEDVPSIGFADEGDEDEESEDATPLVKKLRQQLREKSRELAKRTRAPEPVESDPEPEVPERPRSVTDFEYDEDRFNEAIDLHLAAKDAHAEWKTRQSKRLEAAKNAADEHGRLIEKQRRELGVGDYEAISAKVKDALTENQLAVLVQAADNPAKLIYALGRSEVRLDTLAGQENLAKFAALVGTMEKEVKVGKKTAPAPESRVRGATAPIAAGASDRKLAQLEKDAERTGDRSALIAYRRTKRTA